jgi:hypothetical protein
MAGTGLFQVEIRQYSHCQIVQNLSGMTINLIINQILVENKAFMTIKKMDNTK